MTITAQLFDGTFLEFPDETDPSVVAATAKRLTLERQTTTPATTPASTQRTFGEAITDPLLGIVKSGAKALQIPGQLQRLVTGTGTPDEGLEGYGKRSEDIATSMQSEGLKAREAQRGAKLAEAEKLGGLEGLLKTLGISAYETIKDPALISSFLFEQIPQIALTGGVGKAAQGINAVRMTLAEATAKEIAKSSLKVGVSANIATGALMQGVDVGADTYEEIYKYEKSQRKSDEAARDAALNKARAAAVAAAVISVGAQNLPGAKKAEEYLLGGGEKAASRLGALRVGAVTGAQESLSEGVEEGGGAVAKNVAVQQVDPNRSLMQGVGTATGLGMVGGLGVGAPIGALSSMGGQPTQAPTQPTQAPPPPPGQEQRQQVAGVIKQELQSGVPANEVVEALATQYQEMGLPRSVALSTATQQVENAANEATQETTATPESQRVAEVADELISYGVDPATAQKDAVAKVAEEIRNDAAAAAQENVNAQQTAPPVAPPVTPAVTPIPGADQPSNGVPVLPTTPTGQTTTTGAAPLGGTESTTASPAGGAQAQSAALKTKPNNFVQDNARTLTEAIRKQNPALLDQVTALHAQDLTANEVASKLSISTDLVRELRIGLGLPSQGKPSGGATMQIPGDAEERTKFEAWRNNYNQQNASIATRVKPAAINFALRAVLPADSPTGKKQWQVMDSAGVLLSTHDKKTDADTAVKQIRAEARKAAGQAPAGRRGTLTPEQRAANLQTTRANTNAARSAQTATKQSITDTSGVLDETFDEGPSVDDEDNTRRKQEFDTARIATIAQAMRVAEGKLKNTEAGKAANAVLAHKSITPGERFKAANQVRIAAGLKPILNPVSRSERDTSVGETPEDSTDAQTNTAYLKFETATQALIGIGKNPKSTAFEKLVAARIALFVRDVRIVIVNKNTVLPPVVQAEFDSDAAGVYHNRVIYLDAKYGINNTVFLHEALHAAVNQRILKFFAAGEKGLDTNIEFGRQIIALNKIMKLAREQYNVLNKTGLLDARMNSVPKEAFTNIFEFIAYGMSHPAMQEFLLQTYSVNQLRKSPNLLSRFVASIRGFFGMGPQHQSAMQDLIVITDQLLTQPTGAKVAVTETIPSAAKKSAPKIDKDMEKVKVSNSAAEVTGVLDDGIKGRDFTQDLKDDLEARMGAMDNASARALASTLQTSDILRWKGDEVPGLITIDSLAQDMASTRSNMLEKSTVLAKQVAAFVRKHGQKILGNTMHLARLKSVPVLSYSDRADALANDKLVKHYEGKIATTGITPQVLGGYKAALNTRRADINTVFDQWEALGKQKGGHETYALMRKFYLDNYNLTRTVLNNQIAALPIDATAKAKLLKTVRLMQEDVETDEGDSSDAQKIKQIKQSLREYFPFNRYGEYWLRIAKGPAGPETHFFENGKDRNKFLIQRSRELGLDKEDSSIFSVGDDIAALRKKFGSESQMLQKMFVAIEEAKLTSDAEREALKDQLYQTYLMILPERSIRKQFLHAQEKAGFSSNVFRNFQTYANRFANQIPKLIYGDKIRNAISASRDNLKDQPTTQRGRNEIFLNTIAKRAEETLSPPEPSKLVSNINQFAFLWLLTSPASAATQMASIPIMVMPTLNAEYGYARAAAKAIKYLGIWKSLGVTERTANGDVTYTAPSVGNSRMVKGNPVLERAFEAGKERNIFTTNTSILTNTLRTPESARTTLPSYALQTTYNVMTSLFNGAERISREAAYMMTFELEYAKTKNFDASVNKASELAHDLLGRYDNMNRPDILRNDIGRTLGQFKMYAVYMTSWFMRNAYNSLRISGISMDERIKAMHKLAGTLAMGGVFHGLVGMPLYSTICMTIDAVLDSLGDDEEKKRRIRKNPLTASDSNMRFRYEYLPANFGTITLPGLDMRQHRLSEVLEKGALSALTDINIGSRTSFDNMWFRNPQPGKDWMETAKNVVLANLGPGVSTGVTMAGAIDDFNKGHVVRGLEKVSPAFFRGSLSAYRLGTEGAETRRGDDMLKRSELNDANLVAQVLGFPPARLARIQEQNIATKQELMDAQNRRNKLLDRMNDIIFDPEGSKEGLKSVFQDIGKFNRRYPIDGLLISSDTVQRSLDSYAKRSSTMLRGQAMPPKLMPYMVPLSRATNPLP